MLRYQFGVPRRNSVSSTESSFSEWSLFSSDSRIVRERRRRWLFGDSLPHKDRINTAERHGRRSVANIEYAENEDQYFTSIKEGQAEVWMPSQVADVLSGPGRMRRWSMNDLSPTADNFGPSGPPISVQNVFGCSRVRAQDRDAEIRPKAWSSLRIICFHACTSSCILLEIIFIHIVIGILLAMVYRFRSDVPRSQAIRFLARRFRAGLFDMYWYLPRVLAHEALKPQPGHPDGTLTEYLPMLIIYLPSFLSVIFFRLPIFFVLEVKRAVGGNQRQRND